jgi:predicted nucleotidyltransferase
MTDETLVRDPILREMVRRLVDAYHPQRVYLFGSRGRGEGGPDSDYDLLVVVERSDVPPYKRAMEAFRLLCGVGAAKDVMVWTADEFDPKTAVATSLPATVLREGRLLYAA